MLIQVKNWDEPKYLDDFLMPRQKSENRQHGKIVLMTGSVHAVEGNGDEFVG
jgi:hypothetical protein